MTSNSNIKLSISLNSRKRAFKEIVALLKVKTEESAKKIINHHSSALNDSQTSDNKVYLDNNCQLLC